MNVPTPVYVSSVSTPCPKLLNTFGINTLKYLEVYSGEMLTPDK